MGTKSETRGRYICKVGFYDVYAKDSMKKTNSDKKLVDSTDYLIYHSRKMVGSGLKTKDLAVAKALDLLGNKYKSIYGL
jgi:hypothetical protein